MALSLGVTALRAQDPFALLETLPKIVTQQPAEFTPIAVGPSHVVLAASNADLALFRKSTATAPAQLLSQLSVRTFFANPPGPVDRLTDPDVIFDAESGRFIITMADTTLGAQHLLLAVSKSDSPATLTAQDWFTYRLERNDVTDIPYYVGDFDHLAVAGNKLLVSWQLTNHAPSGSVGVGTTIRILDKLPLLEGRAPATAPLDFISRSSLNLRARPARSATAQDRAADRVFYDIASGNTTTADGRRIWLIGAVSGLSSQPTFVTREVASPFPGFNHLTQIPQKSGVPLTVRPHLAASPAYHDGSLWVFEWDGDVRDGAPSGIYWMEIDVRTWPDNVRVLQSGIYYEPGAWLFSPAGIVDQAGNLTLTFTRSNESEFPSTRLAGRLAVDPAGTLRPGITLNQATRAWAFEGFIMMTVAGAALDASDGSVWVSGSVPSPIRPPTNDGAQVATARVWPADFGRPTITAQPASQATLAGGSVTLTTAASGSTSLRWQRNGTDVANATSSTLILSNLQPVGTGLYTALAANVAGTTTSSPALVGLNASDKITGAADEIGSDIYVASKGNTYDQVLLNGAAAAVKADYPQNQITRVSYIDLDNDIVQVEFSGPGTLSLVLDGSSGPAAPVNYNQAVTYMKGHAGIVITGADEHSNVSVFSVGKVTAVNQALFKDSVVYDGIADLAFLAISSTNGKFGGVRLANANFAAAKGFTGLYAPGVAFQGPVYLGNITAFESAIPLLLLGSSGDARITGGDLYQENARAVQVSGLTQLNFTDGTDSHGKLLPAQHNRAVLQQAGQDVTAQIVVDPTP